MKLTVPRARFLQYCSGNLVEAYNVTAHMAIRMGMETQQI